MDRDPRLPVRRQAVARRDPGGAPGPRRRLDLGALMAALAVAALLVLTPVFVLGALGPPTSTAPARSRVPNAPSATSVAGGSASPSATPRRTPARPSPTASPEPTSVAATDVPLVPVVRFWLPETSITPADLAEALTGQSERWEQVIVPTGTSTLIGQQLGVPVSADVTEGDASAIEAAVRDDETLGIMRVPDVTPRVRALAIGAQSLFGTARSSTLEGWPLMAPAPAGAATWDPTRTWTMVAGGDLLFDRGVYRTLAIEEKGEDFPWEGGTAEITGFRCCSGFGHEVPRWERTGNEGAVKALVSSADIALANLETAVVRDFEYHRTGVTFTSDPKYLDGVKRAGFDFLSLANNHIMNAGRAGIIESRDQVLSRGFEASGAGANLAEASRPVTFDLPSGVRVVVIGCDQIAFKYWADEDSIGTNPCETEALRPQIAAVRETADVIAIFPHWGREYRNKPRERQREDAREWLDAGADIILGNHAHWTAGIEEFPGGKLTFYALGNLVFDQDWSEMTMEGMFVELTYHGSRLHQARLHPFLIVDDAQPNFLERGGDGERVIERVRDGSEHIDW